MNKLRSGKSVIRCLTLSVMAVLLFCLPLSGNLHAGQSERGHAIASDGPIHKLLLADRLVKYGRENYDPLALILAAKMIKGIAFDFASPLGVGKDSKAISDRQVPPLDTAELLGEALGWAGERKDLRALVDEVQNLQTRAVVGNIGLLGSTLAPGKTVVYRFSFEGGSDATVAILHAGGNLEEPLDFDMVVSDDRGRTICKGLERGLPDPCGWAPAKTGVFSVKIRNRGRSEAAFTLLVS